MHKRILNLLVVWLYCNGNKIVDCYKIPQTQLDLLPKGFRVSIPHEPGIENVAFNINRNRPFKAFEQGEFSGQVHTPTANRWTLEHQRRLQPDDTIYVWTDVQYNRTRFRSMSNPIVVGRDSRADTVITTKAPPAMPVSNGGDRKPITTAEPPIIDQRDGDRVQCEPSITVVRNRNACKNQLIFEENFNGIQLDALRWRYEVRLPLDNADAEFVLYDTNAELLNGILKIEPRLWNDDRPGSDIRKGSLNLGTRCTPYQNRQLECQRQPLGQVVLPPVMSARINTKHAFSFKYGRVEVRAKLPQGDWLFPLLLLEPLVHLYGHQPYASGQMRVAFLRGNLRLETCTGAQIDGRVLYGGAVLRPEANYRDALMVNTSRSSHFGETFHVYSLTWDERQLNLAVDGQSYGTLDGGFAQNILNHNNAWTTGSYMAPLDQEFYITLGVAAGGHGDFSDECISKPWTNTSPKAALNFWRARNNWKSSWISPALQVDYVRVYAI